MTMHAVCDGNGQIVFHGRSDAECVRWWRLEGEPEDRMCDTGELMADIDFVLNLKED